MRRSLRCLLTALLLTAALTAVSAALPASPALARPADRAPQQLDPREHRDFLVIGHRGLSALAPEHTLIAYDRAIRAGADYVEPDVQLTADGALVVLHDDTLDRTMRGPEENCTGTVATKTLAQLKTCDAGSWFNEAYPERARAAYVGQRIPTLDEVFARYGRSTNYYVETKPTSAPGLLEQAVLDAIVAHDLRDPAVRRWKVVVQSFLPSSLVTMRALDPELPLVQLGPAEVLEGALPLVATYADGVGPSEGGVDRALVEAAHAACLDVHPYTVNRRPRLLALVRSGVDGIFTNRADRLTRLLGRTAVHPDPAPRAARAHRRC